MNGPSDEFFAGACFSADEDIDVVFADVADNAKDLFHAHIVAVDTMKRAVDRAIWFGFENMQVEWWKAFDLACVVKNPTVRQGDFGFLSMTMIV